MSLDDKQIGGADSVCAIPERGGKNSHKNIFWLASYPKSGNTWVRSFITVVRQLQWPEDPVVNANANADLIDGNDTVDINRLIRDGSMHARYPVEAELGIDLSDFSETQINRLRRDAYYSVAVSSQRYRYVKIHDANNGFGSAGPIASQPVTAGVLYIVRNPLDVAISYANHSKCSVDQSIAGLNNTDMHVVNRPESAFLGHTHLSQFISCWSRHVQSWCADSRVPLLMMRYEDLQLDTYTSFAKIAHFLRLSASREMIEEAIERCCFKRLQQAEALTGFAEGTAAKDNFFRKGIIGDWQDRLSTRQIRQVLKQHKTQMQSLGYLDEAGCPTPLICQQ